ncbi:AraC family transcriptional regulator [Oceanospirillum sanctuarii]|uniref:AraC family transcriptional regulator n=1 Tax=Oceanospirillum sanctuarii TaxID=1434821 RepID=UPI002481F94B|nr:helix-turn-helix transcriptional regulator [Oceanospirillum sanctuarii]
MVSPEKKSPFIHTPLHFDQLPEPILYLERTMPSDTIYPSHRHPWGEFVYSFSGVLELKGEGQVFRVPSSYALWLPPETEHHGLNRHESFHCSLYIEKSLSRKLPQQPCALIMTPLIREMLNHLKSRPPVSPYSEAESRFIQVIFDLLTQAASTGSYLPHSTDPLLIRLLTIFEENPAIHSSLKELAEQLGTTERTLARKAQRDLGISLAEWRQRLRVVRAMPKLEDGEKVESIALELGYSTSSAFIAMFKKMMGVTPDEYRRGIGQDVSQSSGYNTVRTADRE